MIPPSAFSALIIAPVNAFTLRTRGSRTPLLRGVRVKTIDENGGLELSSGVEGKASVN